MALKNPWIGYIERDYFSAKTAIINKLSFLAPEITDHTESNPLIKAIDIFCGILEQTNFYIDTRAREVYLVTLRRFSSALKIARSYDYRVRGTNPASVDLRFFVNNSTTAIITIPIGTEIKTKDGISFFTLAIGTIAINSQEVTIPAIQRTQKTGVTIGTSDGSGFQSFELEADVVDGSIEIQVVSDNYTPVDSLSFAQADDKVFVGSIDENQLMAVEFGDGINGFIPDPGQDIIASYYLSDGASGNVAENTITEIVTTITVPPGFTLQCSNVFRATGGVDIESVTDLKKKVPKSIRTNLRAVSKTDYPDIAEMVNGVAKAAYDHACGKTVDMYIVPTGGGVASETLIADVFNYFEDKRMVTTDIRVFSAGDVRILLTIDVAVQKNFNRVDTIANVLANLLDFMSEDNQNIRGSVFLGDIYQTVENTDGVDHSEVKIMTVLPFAVPVGTAPTLLWIRSILPASSTTNNWKIKIISVSQYIMYKNGNFLGTFDIGTAYDLTDISLTVNAGAYTISDSWTFISYKSFGSVTLTDLSIPTSQAENITLNGSGGI